MSLKIDCKPVRLLVPCLLFFLFGLSASAQKVVTGKVTNTKDNSPIGFATVTVTGTNIATTTNADGEFTINLPAGQTMLTISSIGFTPKSVDASSGNVNVKLTETTSSLDEIVVTGYTAQKKKDLTGSVAVVNVSNLKSVPSGTTESLLQGQASGVTVINSGMPGGGSSVYIRGITSIGNVDPLVIIDGTPGSLHDLNVNDIESIQVLKDAGAASIYGVRGSNGVIIVTTKKGKQGSAKVTYDMYYGNQVPVKGFDLANTQEFANAVFKTYENDGIQITSSTNAGKQFGTGANPVIPDYIIPTGAKEGDPGTDPSDYVLVIGSATGNNQITRADKQGNNWYNDIFKNAPIQSHTLSASGGNDRSSYYFSVGYLNQKGTLIETYLKRYSTRINTTFNIKDKIRVGENAYLFYVDNPQVTNQNEGNPISMAYRMPPIIPIYDIMGNFAGTQAIGLSNAQNPVADQMRSANNRGRDWQMNGNVFAEVDFLKHFTARTSFGGNIDNYYYWSFSPTPYNNAEGSTSANSYNEGSGYNSSWTWTNTLNYSNIFGKHNVKVLVGSEAINNYGRYSSSNRGNYFLTDPDYLVLNTGDPSTQSNSGSGYRSALFSLFARGDYSFNEKYLFSATVRRDGSSLFAPGNQYGVFPSFSGGWRISQESFMQGISWLNDLKIRGGWGKLGSLSNTPSTNQYTLFAQDAYNSYYGIGGGPTSSTLGFYASNLGNTETTWEEDIVTNIGLDATILNNKLDFSIEWYKKAISGLLFQQTITYFAGGASAPYVNLGNIENHGIDASATYHANIGKDLKLDVTGTFTSYNNKVVKLPFQYVDEYSAGSTRIGAFSRLQEGHPVGAFFGYEVIGLFQSADDVSKSPEQEDAQPGFFKYKDVDHNGVIDDNDRTFFGNPNPDFTYGLTINASYKNFDFSAFFYGSQGNDVINYVRYWTDFYQVFNGNVSKDAVYNSWTPNNLNAKVPVLSQKAGFSNTTVFNSYYLENGSYLRCKSLVLGYTLPKGIIQKFHIDKFRLYIQAANLFTITKYTGLDPELQGADLNDNTNFGIDLGNYPSNQKQFLVGVNVAF
ncbi:MAG: TonB-dependent receptor [Bacteroidetes bacterium]|nr:TonB-dependent receptor [Bacteroidota bacterium]